MTYDNTNQEYKGPQRMAPKQLFIYPKGQCNAGFYFENFMTFCIDVPVFIGCELSFF